MDIWFTSDTHYNHKNIVRGTTDWAGDPTKGAASVQRTRDFNTLEEHNDAIVKNINAVVKPNDTLYVLGDWSFGGIESIWDFRKRILCENIHFVLGNHDHHIERNRILPNVHMQTKEGSILVDGPIPTLSDNTHSVTTQELFKSVQHYSRRSIGGVEMVLLHYSLRTWDRMHRGTIHLYGHSHGTLNSNWGKSMDVGIDTHPEFRPYHIDEIRKIMETRVTLTVDHHNESTS